jgi:hypothetical protein
MEGLAQVNLLVGKNNSGKTAILEAIQFLASGGDPGVIEEIAIRRGEYLMARPGRAMIDPSHLFNGHVLKPELSVSITGDNGHKPVHIKVQSTKSKLINTADGSEELPPRYSRAVLRIEGGRPSEREDRIFRFTREGGVDLDTGLRTRRMGISLFGRDEGSLVRFIGADSMDVRQLAAMSDELKVRRLVDEVVDALKILDPDVTVFEFLTGMMEHAQYLTRAGAMIGRASEKSLIPLGSMGDGMRRMLALASSLACTNDGTLLADEIDTGLHYSIMQDMWKLVVKRAIASNVQVFATTHSWDCIEGLSLLCQDDPSVLDKVAIHTIDRSLNRSIPFLGESVARMQRHQIDPR